MRCSYCEDDGYRECRACRGSGLCPCSRECRDLCETCGGEGHYDCNRCPDPTALDLIVEALEAR